MWIDKLETEEQVVGLRNVVLAESEAAAKWGDREKVEALLRVNLSLASLAVLLRKREADAEEASISESYCEPGAYVKAFGND